MSARGRARSDRIADLCDEILDDLELAPVACLDGELAERFASLAAALHNLDSSLAYRDFSGADDSEEESHEDDGEDYVPASWEVQRERHIREFADERFMRQEIVNSNEEGGPPPAS